MSAFVYLSPLKKWEEGHMKYTFDLGFIIAKNTETGERTRAKMTDLRRQYNETGTLPPLFDHRIARQLIGIRKGKV